MDEGYELFKQTVWAGIILPALPFVGELSRNSREDPDGQT